MAEETQKQRIFDKLENEQRKLSEIVEFQSFLVAVDVVELQADHQVQHAERALIELQELQQQQPDVEDAQHEHIRRHHP